VPVEVKGVLMSDHDLAVQTHAPRSVDQATDTFSNGAKMRNHTSEYSGVSVHPVRRFRTPPVGGRVAADAGSS
jgi:hypothetical protein